MDPQLKTLASGHLATGERPQGNRKKLTLPGLPKLQNIYPKIHVTASSARFHTFPQMLTQGKPQEAPAREVLYNYTFQHPVTSICIVPQLLGSF